MYFFFTLYALVSDLRLIWTCARMLSPRYQPVVRWSNKQNVVDYDILEACRDLMDQHSHARDLLTKGRPLTLLSVFVVL